MYLIKLLKVWKKALCKKLQTSGKPILKLPDGRQRKGGGPKKQVRFRKPLCSDWPIRLWDHDLLELLEVFSRFLHVEQITDAHWSRRSSKPAFGKKSFQLLFKHFETWLKNYLENEKKGRRRVSYAKAKDI